MGPPPPGDNKTNQNGLTLSTFTVARQFQFHTGYLNVWLSQLNHHSFNSGGFKAAISSRVSPDPIQQEIMVSAMLKLNLPRKELKSVTKSVKVQ